MRDLLKNSKKSLYVVSVLAVVLLAVAVTNDTVTQTATGAFSQLTTPGSEAAPQTETTAEETNIVDLQKGLQGYWRFDDPEVSRGKSLEFDGQDDYIELNESMNLEENITVSAWVKGQGPKSDFYLKRYADPWTDPGAAKSVSDVRNDLSSVGADPVFIRNLSDWKDMKSWLGTEYNWPSSDDYGGFANFYDYNCDNTYEYPGNPDYSVQPTIDSIKQWARDNGYDDGDSQTNQCPSQVWAGMNEWSKPYGVEDWHADRDQVDGSIGSVRSIVGKTGSFGLSASSGNYSGWINGKKIIGGEVSSDNWKHVSMRYDHENIYLFINGNLQNSTSLSENINDINNTVKIGSLFEGQIDDVRVYNRSLSSSKIEDLYNERPVSREGLVLHQDFNEGPKECNLTSNTACLTEESGNGNDGTPQNFNDNQFNTGSGWYNQTPINRPSVKDYSKRPIKARYYGGKQGELLGLNLSSGDSGWTNGRIGNHALKFDGTDDRVRVQSTRNLPANDSSWTMSFWIYPRDGLNGSNRNGWIIWRGSGPEDTLLSIGAKNNDWEIAHWSNDWTSETNIDFNRWQHVLVSYDSSIPNGSKDEFVYKNGELSDSREAGPLSLLDEDLIFGGRGNSNENADMILDDVRIYDRSLSAYEVESIHNGKEVHEGLVGEWNFEAGNQKKAYDTSSLGRQGVLGTSGVGFDGFDSVEDSHDLNVDDKVTVSSWVKPDKTPRVTGGDDRYYVKDNGTLYKVNAFTETGNSNLQIDEGKIESDILVVGGGGGGSGGGGGAGGVRFEQNVLLEKGSYKAKVGDGGAGRSPSNTAGEKGESSSFHNITVEGGGGGGRNSGGNALNGGSGGGGGHDCGNYGNATNQSYGNRGGDSDVSDCGGVGAAGGGGAGSRAPDGGSNLSVDGTKLIGAMDRVDRLPNGGYGGLGKDYSKYFGDKVGENGYFGGGGGGGINYNGQTIYSRTPGGIGGGGDGAGADGHEYDEKAEGSDGMKNTGGGGGGSDWEGGPGGDGGSGIVLVRYPVGAVASVNNGEHYLGVSDGNLVGSIGNETVTTELRTRGWQHVALNFDGSTQELYIGDEKVASSQFDGTVSSDSEELVIGEKFNGYIDETRVYNRSLNKKEIQRLVLQ